MSRAALALCAGVFVAACAPGDPCTAFQGRRAAKFALPYAGDWIVTHGDTLTLPQMGDRFRLTRVALDTARAMLGRECLFRGTLVFAVPAETLAITWFGQPEQAIVLGWPAELGPFAGIGLAFVGDSLRGSVLFDERMGVQVRPGVTAQFMAGRKR